MSLRRHPKYLLRMTGAFWLYCIGPMLVVADPFWDRTASVSKEWLSRHHLEEGSAQPVDRETLDRLWKAANPAKTEYRLGGSGVNVWNVLAHLNGQTRLLWRGGGERAPDLEKRINELGSSYLLKSKNDTATGVVDCFVTRRGGGSPVERTMRTWLGAAGEPLDEDYPAIPFDGASHVHVEGYLAPAGALTKAIRAARTRGVTISLDLGNAGLVRWMRGQLQEAADHCNVIFGDKASLLELKGQNSLQRAVECFAMEQTIVGTEGPDGCWVKWQGESEAIHYDAPPVSEVIDTTGAGDYFAAGFLDGFIKAMPRDEVIRRAKVAAKFAIQTLGADLDDQNWADLVGEINGE